MHLLASLIAGVAGAEGGTVTVYNRGTVVLSTLYTDFEGTGTTGNPATLDASGRAKLYVNQYAQVVVKNSSGSTVVDYVDGKDAGAVEVRSASLIGTAYSGGSAAGNPLSVEAAFDKLITSFGSTDFNVLLAGAGVTVQSALGALWRARVFDVKAYGALVDGATNDLNAVNAASAAANAAGGGKVFFPPGTCNISGTPSTYANVEWLGCGIGISTIRMTGGSYLMPSSTEMPKEVRGFSFAFTHALARWISCVNTSNKCNFYDCDFQRVVAASGSGVFLFQNAQETRFTRCSVDFGTSASTLFQVTQGSVVILDDSQIVQYFASGSIGNLTGTSATVLSRLTLNRCYIDYSQNGGQNCLGIQLGDYSVARVTGCRLRPMSSTTVYAILIRTNSTTNCYAFEDNNDLTESYTKLTSAPSLAQYSIPYDVSSSAAYWHKGSRKTANVAPDSPNGATITLYTSVAEVHMIRTTAGAGTRLIVTDTTFGSDNMLATVYVHNDTGASITYQWSTGFASAGSTFAVAANSVRCFSLVYSRERTKWFIVSDIAGAETAE